MESKAGIELDWTLAFKRVIYIYIYIYIRPL